jgi:hypothetical protein
MMWIHRLRLHQWNVADRGLGRPGRCQHQSGRYRHPHGRRPLRRERCSTAPIWLRHSLLGCGLFDANKFRRPTSSVTRAGACLQVSASASPIPRPSTSSTASRAWTTTSTSVGGGFWAADHVTTQTVHANILWRPVQQMQLGWEVMWGQYDFDGGDFGFASGPDKEGRCNPGPVRCVVLLLRFAPNTLSLKTGPWETTGRFSFRSAAARPPLAGPADGSKRGSKTCSAVA